MARPKRKRKYTKRAEYWRAKIKVTAKSEPAKEIGARIWFHAEDAKAKGPGLYIRKTPVLDRIEYDVVRFVLIDDGHSPCFRIVQDGQDTSPAVNAASLFQKIEE